MPEAGRSGMDFSVEYDERNKAWVVDLHEGTHYLKTFIEDNEAETCLESEKCIPLGLQVSQLKHNFNLYRRS